MPAPILVQRASDARCAQLKAAKICRVLEDCARLMEEGGGAALMAVHVLARVAAYASLMEVASVVQ